MLRVGLIGFGLAGQAFHAPTIRGTAGMELACILERSRSLAQQKYPGVRVARTLEELLADETIRLVVVATPNTSHFDLARQCMMAGRDVVVDKPFTTTTQEARELIHIAGQQKRLLAVYHNRRWDGDFATVKKLIASGTLGRLVAYESHYDRFRPQLRPSAWRERPGPGSGILYDLGPHLIDQAMTLYGLPKSVTADVFAQRDGAQVDDAFDLRFEYPGLRATLRSSMLALAARPRFLLHGMQGSFVKYGMDPQEEFLRRGEFPSGPDWGPHWGEDPEEQWGLLSVPEGNSSATKKVKTERGDYRGFYANVRHAIERGEPPAVTAKDGLRSIRAIELALESSRERRTVPWSENG